MIQVRTCLFIEGQDEGRGYQQVAVAVLVCFCTDTELVCHGLLCCMLYIMSRHLMLLRV